MWCAFVTVCVGSDKDPLGQSAEHAQSGLNTVMMEKAVEMATPKCR